MTPYLFFPVGASPYFTPKNIRYFAVLMPRRAPLVVFTTANGDPATMLAGNSNSMKVQAIIAFRFPPIKPP